MPPSDQPLPAPQTPLFSLAFEASFCRFELRINDLPAMGYDVSERELLNEVPINHSLLTGDNVLSMALRAGERANAAKTPVPLDHPAAKCIAEVTVRPMGTPASARRRLLGIQFENGRFAQLGPEATAPSIVTPGPLATVLETTTASLVRQAFALATPFPAWLWTRADRLTLDDATTAELLAQYRQFWSSLQQRDVGAIRAATFENARELQSAFFLPDLNEAYGMLEIEDMVRRPSNVVAPMELDLRMELLADGRVARLIAGDGRSPVRVNDPEIEATMAISLLYCRVPGRGWVQIR